MNSFLKKAFYRAPWTRCVVAATVLSLASCATPKTAYKRHPRPKDTDEYYRDQQEWAENRGAAGVATRAAATVHGPRPGRRAHHRDHPDQPGAEPSPPPIDSYPQGTVPKAEDIPTAKPGKDGIVESPFVPGKQVDIQGYPPGATVRDPYTNKIFIVPIPSPTPNQ